MAQLRHTHENERLNRVRKETIRQLTSSEAEPPALKQLRRRLDPEGFLQR
jgi:hypothetical protein